MQLASVVVVIVVAVDVIAAEQTWNKSKLSGTDWGIRLLGT